MPSIDFDKVREDVNLDDAVRAFEFPVNFGLVTVGRGPCPACIHPDGRRCSYRGIDNVWHCHRCGAGGGVIDFAIFRTGFTVYEAVRELYRRLNRLPPYVRRNREQRPRGTRKQQQEVAPEEEDGVK